ncbi:hypothetical protein [Sphingobacterium sp. JUb56]|uniref:hypothetical protein n=1 Tax=Sphingobacterium sp. JUb56 TaxID=2587145 RepID=UPI001C848E5C|nr:hypothetical protein [Sphingobacterium sp. JUb56]
MTGITAGKMKREILLQIYNRDTLNITWPLIKSALPYIFFKKKNLAVIDSEKEDKGDEDRFTIEFNKNSGKIDKFLMCFSYFLLIQTLLIFLAIIFFLIKDEYALAFGSLVLFVPICFALIVVSASRFPYRDAKKLKQMAKEFTTE